MAGSPSLSPEACNAENIAYVKLTIPITIDGLPLQGNRRWVEGEAFVYRLYGEGRRLLWIGCTNDLRRRLRQHRTRKAWWPEVVSCEAKWFDNYREAGDAERGALWRERPAYNLMFVGGQLLPYRQAPRRSAL